MNAQMIPRASAPFRSNAVEYAGPPIAWMWSASSCRTSGWPSALFAVPQLIAPFTTVQMSWSSASATTITSGEWRSTTTWCAISLSRCWYSASLAGG